MKIWDFFKGNGAFNGFANATNNSANEFGANGQYNGSLQKAGNDEYNLFGSNGQYEGRITKWTLPRK
jgi:hypothetical protein